MSTIGQEWSPTAYPVELYALGGEGTGVPLRATVSSFGPLLLSKVLALNATQESSLGLVFHYADQAGLPLLDLADLQALLRHLTSDEGKAELKGIGGGRHLGYGRARIRSLPDAIAQVLAEHLGLAESEEALSSQPAADSVGDLCPECGQGTLVFEEGCQKCYSCGYTEC